MKSLPREVVIVGGGASGTLAAIHLLARMPEGRVGLIERTGQAGRGLAYSTNDPRHRLNVRAAKMSAWPDAPDDFVRWLAEHEGGGPETFIERRWFGEYLTDALERVSASSRARFEIVRGEATSVSDVDGLAVGLRSGEILSADAVVFATGHRPSPLLSGPTSLAGHPRVIGDPLTPGTLAKVGQTESVLIVGTGLTMVDTVLTLDRLGHRGAIYARSRHGLLPHPHRHCSPACVDLAAGPRLSSRLIDAARAAGGEWRGVLDALRPASDRLWQSMTWDERLRFRRRLQTYWDVHRHRCPEDVASFLEDLAASGRLCVKADALCAVQVDDGRLLAETRLGEEIRTDWLVVCAGSSGCLATDRVPVIESAVEAGLARYDPLGWGLVVDDVGRTSADGRAWALGPICLGSRLETTAIPEIRAQAQRLSLELTASG